MNAWSGKMSESYVVNEKREIVLEKVKQFIGVEFRD